ncbi:MAG: polyphosphate kinase [Actinomycetota bacterium]|nr:polyphosphate kinase [Actinomycetota bacterium]
MAASRKPERDGGRAHRKRVWDMADLGEHLDTLTLEADNEDLDDPILVGPDGTRVDTWRENYPYDERLERPDYEWQKRILQVELLKMQEWVQDTGQRVAVLFEGRDAAGKGGTIKRFMEHLNPKAARIVALGKPTERESGQWYFQRYVAQLPSAGEIVLFDRSWYNRAGVERVMGWTSDEKYQLFLQQTPVFEKLLTDDGMTLIKLWFSVSRSEQRTRFIIRRIDPVRQWKLSATDLALVDRWDDFTAAKAAMFEATDSDYAPWTVIRSNDKRRARVAAMREVLRRCPYPDKDQTIVGKPDSRIVGPPWRIYESDEQKIARPPGRAPARKVGTANQSA